MLIVGSLPLKLSGQQRDLRFETKPAMYAANEEWLTFACELPEGMVDIKSKHASEMYWYSRYALGNLLFRSGMGVHMVNNPLFKKHAKEDKGMAWHKPMMPLMGQRKFMLHKMAQFKRRSGADKANNFMAGLDPPPGAYPIYLEYSSGNPSFIKDPQLDDFSTLRWNKKDMDKSMNPGAWGQSMMKQVLWARDFFTGHRTSGGVTYLGNSADDGANGFRGGALTAMALTKTYALKTTLAYNAKTGKLGGVDPKTYDPSKGAIYYPHEYQVKYRLMMMKPMMNLMMKGKVPQIVAKFKVTDVTSDLFDVASLLWAQSEFYYYTDPKVKDDFDAVFGDPKWNPRGSDAEVQKAFKAGKTLFPAKGPHMLAQGISVVNFKNIMGLHFKKTKGTLVDTWHPETGQGNHISTANAGMAVVALANTYHRLSDIDKVRNGAKMILTAQANFLLDQQSSDGSIANGFTLGTSVSPDRNAKTLLAQSMAIRAWIAAYRVSNDNKYLAAAERTYDFMQKELWSARAGVYRSAVNASSSKFDGMNYGATLGALRELAISKEGSDRVAIVARLDEFFDNVANKNGLQIAEITPTGEPIPSAEKAAQMQANMKKLKETNPKKAKAMMAMMRDADKDGVPKPKFVMGTKYGAAPVTAGSVTISTPRSTSSQLTK